MNPLDASSSNLSQQDKIIVITGLLTVAALGWIYMFYMAWAMENMHLVDIWMPPRGGERTWTAWDFILLFLMWLTMMLAMMTPTAAPMVMMFTTVNKQKKVRQQPYVSTFIFLAGYLVAWAIFSIVASAIQWPLHESGLLNPMMNSRPASGVSRATLGT